MTSYIRTPEIQERNRRNAVGAPQCGADCTCRRHRTQIGRPGRPCPEGCTCGRHTRSREHNARIGMSVALTAEAKR